MNIRNLRRLSKFAGSIAALNADMLALPYRVNFCVTYACQSKCMMCNIWQMRPNGELKLDEIAEIAKRSTHLSWVQLTGGEPTMRRDLVDIASLFDDFARPYILTSQTNSLSNPGHTEKVVRGMASLRYPHFVYTLSLDGPPEIHDAQRGVKGNFDKVMDLYGRIRSLKEERPGFEIVFGYTMTSLNAGRFRDCVRSVQEVYPEITEDRFHLNMAQVSEHYYGNEANHFEPDRAGVASEVRSSIGRRAGEGFTGWAESKFLQGLVQFAQTGAPPLKTRELQASYYLDSYGDVYPSVMWGLKLGSLRETGYDLRPLWNGPVSSMARDMVMRGVSPKHWTSCEAYSSILGSIPRTAGLYDRLLFRA